MPGPVRRIALPASLFVIAAYAACAGGPAQAARQGASPAVGQPAGTARLGTERAGRLPAGSGLAGCQPDAVRRSAVGFRPMQASDAQLRANGFPPRPPASDQQEVRIWQTAMQRAKTFIPPDAVCGTGRRGAVYSDNWAGHVVPRSLYRRVPFTAAEALWVQPAVPGTPGFRNVNNAPTASFWVGIGVANLIQAGVDSIGTATPRYRFWTEDFPLDMVWEGPAIAPGQTAFVYLQYLGDRRTYFYLENVTTGQVSAFTNPAPYVGADAVNFVNERPDRLLLPRFRPTIIRDASFWQGGTAHALTTANERWYMTSNCRSGGTGLSVPSAVSAGSFAQVWQHSRPFVNAC